MRLHVNGLLLVVLCVLFSTFAAMTQSGCSDDGSLSLDEEDGDGSPLTGDGSAGSPCDSSEDCNAGLECDESENVCVPIAPDGDEDLADLPRIEVARTLDFGSVPLGSTSDRELTVANIGTANLEIYSLELSGQGLEDFTLLDAPDTVETVVIEPQNVITVSIRYAPQQAGAANVEMQLVTNDPANRVVKIALTSQYKGTQDIESDPASLSFADTVVGEQTEPLCVTVKNSPLGADDNKVLTLTAIRLESGAARNFEIQDLPALPMVLSPVQEQTLCVVFHPIILGDHSDAILIENDDPDADEQLFRIPLSGEGVQPKIAVSPSPIQFNRVNIGLTATIDGSIENQGGAPLTVSGLEIQGEQADRFGFAVQTPANADGNWIVDPHGSLPVQFSFSPTQEGSASAEIVITNDDPERVNHTVGLLGYGAYGSLRSNPAHLAFPLTRVNESSTASLTIINQGDINVTVTGFDFGSETGFATEEAADTLFPFVLTMNGDTAQREVVLTFNPVEERNHEATITVLTDDPNLNFTITAQGVGGLPHYASIPEETTFNMGEIRLGDTVTQAFTVRNSGTYPMIVQDIQITAGSDPAFSLIEPPTEAVTLQPDESLPLSVQFHLEATADTGQKFGAMTLTTDDADFTNVTVNLQARAINPQLLISPEDNPYNFGDIMVGDQSDAVTFRLRNVGVGDLTISNIEMTSGDDWFVLANVPDFSGGALTLRPMGTGDVITFTATFIPVGFSPYEAEVRIYTNTYEIPVTLLQFQGVGQGCPEGQHMCNLECYSNFSVETCGTRCPGDPCPEPDNTSATCDGVDCGYECFPTWWLDCNGEDTDGCEVNSYTNLDHCGGCFEMCDKANAAESCQLGVCTLGECDEGYDNCNENAEDGCETDIFTDLQNCGACEQLCDVEGAEEICDNGICQMASCEGNYRDCNTNPTDGCETDVMSSSLQHCGACYQECDLDNAEEHCEEGVCTLDSCIDPYRNCNNNKADGCEINIHTDVDNCGDCFQSCHLDNTESNFCIGGECRIDDCSDNYADCNNLDLDGCEVALLNDVENCGACNRICELPNGINLCVSGSCQIGSCQAPFDDCTAQPGCETNLYENPNHCGGCDQACDLDNAVPVCQLGDCQVGTCIGSYADCNGQDPDGCEIDTDSNINHCGGCGQMCDLDNAETHQCVAGGCQVVSCDAGYRNCNGLHPDGCEIHTSSDVTNCGACDHVCDLPHAETHDCVGGSCKVAACDSGYADCNATDSDGCEISTDTDVLNCGACNRACNLPHVVSYTCTEGSCGVGECAAGWADCTDAPGCETHISEDAQNCGGCGAICDLANTDEHLCVSGVCQVGSCLEGFGNCNGQPTPNDGCEINLTTNVSHCGACGQVCDLDHTLTHACVAGSCQVNQCDQGFEDCNTNSADGCEINTQTDSANCGGCGDEYLCDLANTNAHECYNGTCRVVSCDEPFANCDGESDNGCEINLNTDVDNCSQCHTACNLPHTSDHTCTGGVCHVASCDEPFGDCNGDSTDGCETNTDTNVTHCGACDDACALPGGTNVCEEGHCEVSGCFEPLADCTDAPGCETNTDSSLAHCGACDAACAPAHASGQCNGGNCEITLCAEPWADCNANDADGCEIDTDSTVAHCGACGQLCDLSNVAVHSCSAGSCGVVSCDPGYEDCNGLASDGCEVNINTDTGHCGACNQACALDHVAVHECVAGSCQVVSCADPYVDCDNQDANGCEINSNTNTDHCGGCFQECALPQASAHACVAGSCQVTACSEPFDNCNGQPTPNDGCETNTDTNVTHCGACGSTCTLPGGTNVCTDGSCEISSCTEPYADCTTAAGCETNTDSSLAHCGGCNQPCAPAHASGQCSSGSCLVAACNDPWADCNANPADGCEIDTDTNITHCGACGQVCNLPNVATHGCAAGACTIGTCAPGYRDCNGIASDGCEVDITTNTNHCGACDAACDLDNTASHSCVSGTCRVTDCDANYANCDANDANGCEINTQTTLTHCGGCFNACNLAHASAQACVGGSCQVTACTDPYDNCNTAHPDGCEINTDTNASHCGDCNTACNLAHANNACVDGSCEVSSCSNPWADCNGVDSDGCEINTDSSLAHCGGCNQPCAPAHASGECNEGSCEITLCSDPWADCNNNDADGCEINTDSNTNHCGACGTVCDLPHVAVHTCTNGGCGIQSCDTGYEDCNGIASDGCEVDTRSDTDHCGGCGTVCDLDHTETHTCEAGICQVASCDSGYDDCNNVDSDGCEIDIQDNASHCGGCGQVCNLPHTNAHSCNAGVCEVSSCDSGYNDCNGVDSDGCEINTQNNTSNCGGCGAVCNLPNTSSHSCISGVCSPVTCDSGYANCNGLASDGCEVNTQTSTSNCGGCGTVCDLDHTNTHSCVAGSCRVATCDSGYGNCNGTHSDGCEISLSSDPSNCGLCGKACQAPNVDSYTCQAGLCGIDDCTGAYDDCNGSFGDGCETNTDTNVSHCGACNSECNLNHTEIHNCAAGSCQVATCDAGYDDCNNVDSDGCEISTDSDTNNCGGCGTVCDLDHTATHSCVAARCRVSSCDSGYSNCDGNHNNGCEINTTNDVNNCGSCSNVCNLSHVNAHTCSSSTCRVSSCDNHYVNCDSNHANGCEVGLGSSVSTVNACSTSYSMGGSIAGDEGSEYRTVTSRGSKWYKVEVTEEVSSIFDYPDLKARIYLTVPSGVDYDLVTYRDGCSSNYRISASKTNGVNECTSYQWNDDFASNDDEWVYAKVYHYSGESCSNWTLRITGHTTSCSKSTLQREVNMSLSAEDLPEQFLIASGLEDEDYQSNPDVEACQNGELFNLVEIPAPSEEQQANLEEIPMPDYMSVEQIDE